MNTHTFEIELDGRRVLVNQVTQEVQVLDECGRITSCERIQVAAGSIQGIFSAVQDVSSGLSAGASTRNV